MKVTKNQKTGTIWKQLPIQYYSSLASTVWKYSKKIQLKNLNCTIFSLLRWNGHCSTDFGWFVTITKPFIHILSWTPKCQSLMRKKVTTTFLIHWLNCGLNGLKIDNVAIFVCSMGYPLMPIHSVYKTKQKTFWSLFVVVNEMPQCYSTLFNDNRNQDNNKKLFTFFLELPLSRNEWIWAQIKLQLKNVCCGFLVVRKGIFVLSTFFRDWKTSFLLQ